MQFKVKKSTKFSKVGGAPAARVLLQRQDSHSVCLSLALHQIFEVYCGKKGTSRDMLRFVSPDGDRVRDHHTPDEVRSAGGLSRPLNTVRVLTNRRPHQCAQLHLEDGDCIEAIVEQARRGGRKVPCAHAPWLAADSLLCFHSLRLAASEARPWKCGDCRATDLTPQPTSAAPLFRRHGLRACTFLHRHLRC